MAKQRIPMTTAELLAHLRRDKEWMARHQAKYEEIRKRHRALAKAEAPLVRALRAAGVKVKSVWDLVNTNDPYPKAIPVLLAHFDLPYDKRIKDGIIRALTVREARGLAVHTLLRAFQDEQDEHLKWSIGNALSEVADASVAQEVIALARDPSHGNARQMLLVAVRKIGTAESKKALKKLLERKYLKALYDNAHMR